MVIEVHRSPDISAEDVSERTESDDRFGEEDLRDHTMSSDMQGMQHKLNNSWKNSYSSEYQAMAEDGTETARRTLPDTIHNGGAGGIVSNLLRKSNGFREGMYIGGIGAGLEQKIQELRAEKEAGEMIKCPTSIHNDQDSPIDFSVKRRSSFSGSLTDDSQASLCSPGNATDYSVMSPTVDSESANHSGDISKRSTPSPHRFDDQKMFSQPDIQVSPLLPNPSLTNGMGLFSGLSSNLLGNGSHMNSFSQMAAAAAFVDPRSKKQNRPFKAYPKEALQMPLGFFGIPGLTPAAVQKGMESGIFSGMSSEDIVNLYNRQLHIFKDKQLSGQEGSSSPPSLMSASSRNHVPRHHPHQQNSHHETNSSSLAYPSTPTSISPPLAMPEHLKTNNAPSNSYPIPVTAGSVNTTVVSSTSSYAHSNSRKRPRSLPDDQKDAAYWERRRKNNDAAKRSRDARRAKEDEIAIRAALLEQENIKLRVEVAALKTETARLRCLLYNN